MLGRSTLFLTLWLAFAQFAHGQAAVEGRSARAEPALGSETNSHDFNEMLRQAWAARKAGKPVEAESIVDELARDVRSGADINQAVWVIREYHDLDRPAKAGSLYESALQFARRNHANAALLGLLSWKALTAWLERNYAEAETALKELVILCEGETGPEAEHGLEFALGLLGATEDGLGHLTEAEHLFLRQGALPTSAWVMPPCAVSEALAPGTFKFPSDLADFYSAHGHPDKAEELYRRLVKESAHRSIAERYWALGGLGFFLYQHKRQTEFEAVRENQIQLLLSSPSIEERFCGHSRIRELARLRAQDGDFAAARTTIDRAVAEALKRDGDRSLPYLEALLLHVDLALNKRDCAAAQRALAEARTAAKHIDSEIAGASFEYRLRSVTRTCH
jgi:hypothetical protein